MGTARARVGVGDDLQDVRGTVKNREFSKLCLVEAKLILFERPSI